MAEITYPTTIKTDFERLKCGYSLVEQMRLEHNRQGEIARSDWAKYQGKWAEYSRRFHDLQLPLLREQHKLKGNIILENGFSQESWTKALEFAVGSGSLSEFLASYFGDKHVLRSEQTGAGSRLLEQLKGINLDKLEGQFQDPTEDFTTYTEDDPDSVLTVTADKVSWSALDREAGTRVYDDKGIGHFGDFEHLITIACQTYGTGAYYAIHWFLSNDGPNHTWYIYPQLNVYAETHSSGSYYKIVLYERDDGDNGQLDYTALLTIDSVRYLTIERSGTDLTCKVYTDSERTDLEDTLSLGSVTETTMRYVGAVCSFGGGAGDWNLVGYSEALDLQEGGVTEKSSSDTGSGSDAKTSGNPVATLSKLETGSGAEGTPTQTATLVKSESGSGVEVKTDYPGGEIAGSESGEGSDTAALMAVIAVPGDSGIGVEVSYLVIGFITKVGSDTGIGTETGAVIVALISSAETGSGVEAVRDRALILAESGNGAESSSPEVVWMAIDAGAGVETSVLIPVFFSGDIGLGSELIRILKDIRGGDGGSGCDALKALVGAAGAGSDMRLHGRSGQVKMPSRRVRMPSKGVNI